MYIQQLYTGCLSEAAYYIESDSEAAIIDPLRDIQSYIDLAESRKSKIVFVFETHIHADFVSGHIDLSKKTKAPIIFGPDANISYEAYHAKDGEKLRIGKVEIEVIHTPGHTLESTCYLLRDEYGKPNTLFSGDTLFVGDVGRPDLLDGIATKEQLSGLMYDSLNKIKLLPDDVIVYPAHGPGSACGKNLGPDTYSTIGEQKKANYALQKMTKDKFIGLVTEGLMAPPKYFAVDAAINKKGYIAIDELIANSQKGLTVSEFEKEIQNGAILLDTRNPEVFEKGFIPNSINIGLNGRFAEWVGILLDNKHPIVLITDAGRESESIIRMARVGYENVKGYLQGGLDTWKKENKNIDLVISIDTNEFLLDIQHDENVVILDVRKPQEYDSSHIENAINIPLNELEKNISSLNKKDNLYVHCAAGYKSMIASSILKKHGLHNFHNIIGGYGSISKNQGIQLVKSLNHTT